MSMSANTQNSQAMSAGPLFVVGMWRSGTSLLYALLNQHPQIRLMYESDLPLLTPLFLFGRKSSWWLHKFDAWNGALTRHSIDADAIDDNITDLPGGFRAIAQQYAAKKGATIWGCKSPNYYDCMNQLADWFPQAKFIVIWRDPADVCRSIIRAAEKSPWFAQSGMDLRALVGYRRMKQEADRLESRRASVYQLQYDELVRDPEATLKAICSFVGVPFEPQMLSLEDADRSAIYNGEHHAGVRSASIVSKRERPEVLSPELKSKIQRYVVYWRKQSGGNWPIRAKIDDGTPSASFLERTSDRVRHRLLRTADQVIPFAYSFVPIRLWQKYRQVKSRYQRVAPQPTESKAIS